MPAIADLDHLANDPDYTAAVRDATRQLIATGAANDLHNVAPLASYGPGQSGSILRLPFVLRDLDPRQVPAPLLEQLATLAARIPD